MGSPQLKVGFLAGVNHQTSSDLNGAELIYTCPGPASKPLNHKICPFLFFFKPLHFYYSLKGTLKCLLARRIKYWLLKFILWSFPVIGSVQGSLFSQPRPRGGTETPGNVQRSRTGSEPAQELLGCSQGEHFAGDLPELVFTSNWRSKILWLY